MLETVPYKIYKPKGTAKAPTLWSASLAAGLIWPVSALKEAEESPWERVWSASIVVVITMLATVQTWARVVERAEAE